jgi:cold shock protein
MNKGRVKFFNEKGYGFILDGTTKQEIFFHINDAFDTNFASGSLVSFEIKQTERGQRAYDVRLV